MLEVPVRQDEMFVPGIARNGDSRTVAVYTRHKPECPNKGNPYWRKCRCTKYLYIYANGASRQISAKTRSWEKAEDRAQEIRESFDPAKQLQRELAAKTPTHNGGIEITQATDEFMKEIERLNREEATRKKYKLTGPGLQPHGTTSINVSSFFLLLRWTGLDQGKSGEENQERAGRAGRDTPLHARTIRSAP